MLASQLTRVGHPLLYVFISLASYTLILVFVFKCMFNCKINVLRIIVNFLIVPMGMF